MSLEIVTPGPFATVQDLGRPGLAGIGVGGSGAADRGALRLANRLVGNPESAAAVELTLGGLVATFRTAALIALSGAPCRVTVGGRAADMYAPVWVPAGAEIRLGTPESGLRSYLAVRGGLDVPPVLGSRATDTMAGLGPAPLVPGSVLPIGQDREPYPAVDFAPQRNYPAELTLRVIPGPRADWFTAAALDTLCGNDYLITPDSNRVGVRLSGPPLERRIEGELPSEATVLGALQVPASGQPILFLADHPVTGGYPVIAVVTEADIDLAAQGRSGQTVHFRLW